MDFPKWSRVSKLLRTRDAKSAFCGRSKLAIHPPELPEESGNSGGVAFPAAVTYAWFVCGSLVVMVIALSMPFQVYLLCNQQKGENTMPETRNLYAQLPSDLHQRVCEAREELGQTTAQ